MYMTNTVTMHTSIRLCSFKFDPLCNVSLKKQRNDLIDFRNQSIPGYTPNIMDIKWSVIIVIVENLSLSRLAATEKIRLALSRQTSPTKAPPSAGGTFTTTLPIGNYAFASKLVMSYFNVL